ncbi:MAG: beta-N-acetylhexosaminidase [Bacteroidales bacterium]|nr:beta-N-acetylhexosaminidase [Bacteroidales bacterium]
MKHLFAAVIAIFAALSAQAQVPAPVQMTRMEGAPNTSRELSRKIGGKAFARKTASLPAFAWEEAYELTLTPKGYKVEANTETGYFRALQTLRQLDGCAAVYDYPRFQYRGFMLDISRHFRDKDFILKQMKALSSLKINVLHLHLTDDAGWRLQVDSYPKLTSEAAWREGATWKEWQTTGRKYSKEGAPEAYGGYLTKADVREILAEAERLHMTVIPEIEMPGHSREVVFAYPEVGCREGSYELCPGKEATFTLLESVLEEVIGLFPSEYIHIGGDEADKEHWESCPDCQARMQAEGLGSVEELQSYLVRRIERFINAHGRQLLGWDEILEGGLSPNATVMSWRGTKGGIEAVSQGHDAVMTPGRYCYLDKVQDAPLYEPEGFGGYLPLDVVHSYDPLQDIPEEGKSHILGVQGNLWHERIPTPEHTEYMMYPRVAAIAEVGWSQPENKDGFLERVTRWNDALIADGYNAFDIKKEYGERPAFKSGIRHKAVGKKVTYNTTWSGYPAAGEATFTDGIGGGWSYGDGRWQGFLKAIDVVIDMDEVQDIHFVGGTFLCEPGPDIFLPKSVEVWLSEDGERFEQAAVIPNEIQEPSQSYVLFGTPVQGKARYIRFVAHPTRGFQFLDEIVVN